MKKIDSLKAGVNEYYDILKLAAESIKDATENTYIDKKEEYYLKYFTNSVFSCKIDYIL